MDKDIDSYEEYKAIHGVVSKNNYDFITRINAQTISHLKDEWVVNIKKNKKFWRKHQKIRGMAGLGINKAVIGVGAGPSLKKNKDVLKHFIYEDCENTWERRNFITIAANHQFKPLLEMGIIPDFVLLVDASDVVMDQLNKDIPKEALNTQLITGVHASPKVIGEWDSQGRGLIFYTPPSKELRDVSKKHIKRGYEENQIELGGNVLNGAFMIGVGALKSTVFMGVGNDLSFEIDDDLDKQRKGYYDDGDYSTNAEATGTGRDEGKCLKRWAGYSMERKRVIQLDESIGSKKRYNFNLDIVGTSHTLWVYKTWLETTMMGQTRSKVYFHYFNCTEGGILGVMARKDDDESLRDPANWYFLDEVCINKHTGKQMYATAMLEDAMELFLKIKRSRKWENQVPTALYANGSSPPG
jgi:hypothetical protein